MPSTAKDIDALQLGNPKLAAVPKGDIMALVRADPRLVLARPPIVHGQPPASPTLLVARCKAGYTERRANLTDNICVTTTTQLDTARENAESNTRKPCPHQ